MLSKKNPLRVGLGALLAKTLENALAHKIEKEFPRIGREDRAMLRSNLSARSMPEDGQEHVLYHMLLPFRSSFGRKAINLLSWCEYVFSQIF